MDPRAVGRGGVPSCGEPEQKATTVSCHSSRGSVVNVGEDEGNPAQTRTKEKEFRLTSQVADTLAAMRRQGVRIHT